MSSFRIDRQYVAFETAETQPVFATNKVQNKITQISETETYTGDVSKLYNEMYEKLQREHAEQAENMLSRAADEAHEIVDKARKQAEEINRQAIADAERMREETAAELEAAAADSKNRAEATLSDLETQLKNEYAELVEGMHDKVIALVMDIVKKIISVKLAQTDEVFIGMIKEALERLKQKGSVLIRVSPEDHARYFGKEREDLGFDSDEIKITAVEEPYFEQGDLIVESEGEMLDLCINRQINLIEETFLS